MTQKEIYEKINMNNNRIKDIMQPNIFTLNNTVSDLLKENRELQDQCQHEYEDDVCVWCQRLREE